MLEGCHARGRQESDGVPGIGPWPGRSPGAPAPRTTPLKRQGDGAMLAWPCQRRPGLAAMTALGIGMAGCGRSALIPPQTRSRGQLWLGEQHPGVQPDPRGGFLPEGVNGVREHHRGHSVRHQHGEHCSIKHRRVEHCDARAPAARLRAGSATWSSATSRPAGRTAPRTSSSRSTTRRTTPSPSTRAGRSRPRAPRMMMWDHTARDGRVAAGPCVNPSARALPSSVGAPVTREQRTPDDVFSRRHRQRSQPRALRQRQHGNRTPSGP